MLERCIAHLVARGDVQLTMLERIGARAGFGAIQPGARHGDGTPSPILNFFLVHHELGTATLEAALRSIRTSHADEIRYAPVVLFATDGPFEQYLDYIDMGFDDIVTLPENAGIVEQRLIAQLGTEHLYFETPTYFGPDRRRMEIEPPIQFRRADVPHSHVRHYFSRDPQHGIVLGRSDAYLASGHQPIRVERVG